ncbi:MAG: nucleotide exchange factor GrpE [Rhizobiaceae bacterium]
MNDHPENKKAEETNAESAKAPKVEAANDDNAGPENGEGGDFAADHEAFLRLAAENEELKDKALRVAAEMENLRKRTARDVHDARAYSIAAFARDMLGVGDNLRRALDAIPAEALEAGESGLKSLAEGVEMTARDMLTTLERHGVKKLSPQGEKFDPNFHQAMFEVQNPEVPNNTVTEVVQEGYVIGERVLRPAMVGVAKGGPKNAAPPADTAPETEENAETGQDA